MAAATSSVKDDGVKVDAESGVETDAPYYNPRSGLLCWQDRVAELVLQLPPE
jgi:hypothetical protein